MSHSGLITRFSICQVDNCQTNLATGNSPPSLSIGCSIHPLVLSNLIQHYNIKHDTQSCIKPSPLHVCVENKGLLASVFLVLNPTDTSHGRKLGWSTEKEEAVDSDCLLDV